ncbi:MAG TPA: AMP-dependent synthetase [Thermodesulfobium narugense]|nr:MAG: AMP-dependent synthetase [Thermodesulfobium narugense]HEM55800.1 AMP-dependent synthetase [Thermodesulfobium narugense]
MKRELEEFLKLRDFILSYPDYEQCRREFKWPHLTKFNWALDYFDFIASNNNDTALLFVDDDGKEIWASYDFLRKRSNQVANFLKEIGLQKRDRVMVMMENSVSLFEILLGVMKAGGVIIPAATMLPAEDVAERIETANIKFVFVDGDIVPKLSKIEVIANKYLNAVVNVGNHSNSVFNNSKGKSPIWINYIEVDNFKEEYSPSFITYSTDEMYSFFTSGTTAKPKLVTHNHNYPVGHLTTLYWVGCTRGDIHYNISAPGWAKHAWSSVFVPWNAQATAFIYKYKGRFNPKNILSKIEKYKITTLCAPLSVWKLFLIENLKSYKFSLREIVSAGEPLNPEVIKKVKEYINLNLREGYGQTESTLMIGNFKGEHTKKGSMGKAAPGYNLSILSNQLDLKNEGEDGQIGVNIYPIKPLGILNAYNDSAKNESVFKGGYYLSGDTAYVDKDGYFYFVGRTDDVFKSLDYRISPFEVESEIMEHHAVLEVAVVPTTDEREMIVPKAFIVLKPDYIPSREMALELFRFIRKHVAPYKRPRFIEFLDSFPKTVSAKIIRKDLREYDQKIKKKKIKAEHEYREKDFLEEIRGSV